MMKPNINPTKSPSSIPNTFSPTGIVNISFSITDLFSMSTNSNGSIIQSPQKKSEDSVITPKIPMALLSIVQESLQFHQLHHWSGSVQDL